LIDKLAHFDRERIPERVVHAKGAGAHGYFEVTNDVTPYCKAAFLNKIGKRTPVFLRFSTVGGEKGSADSERDPRGFAVKFYTEEGNYDMVGNNTPVFFIRDPSQFPDFIHTQKRHPATNLKDADMMWDFLSRTPESVHQVTILFSDRGTPLSYRHMNGYSSHTYKWVNAKGEAFYVKKHFKTETGVKSMTDSEAAAAKSSDPDCATRDLYEHIAKGGEAAWKLYVQLMPVAAAATYRFNVLDITKVWPHSDFPLIPVGRLVLNRNPDNYFAEVEQAAFTPAHLVPGIEPSEDKMLQGRLFSYGDTHRHRLGANYLQLPINCPFAARARNHQRDGPATVDGNQGSAPNYFPNMHGSATVTPASAAWSAYPVSGVVARHDAAKQHPNSDYEQAGALYSKVMTDTDRDHLIKNIVGNLKNARREIQERQIEIFAKAHPDYGRRVREGLSAYWKDAAPRSKL